MRSAPVEERFWEYVNRTEDCWTWTGCLQGRRNHKYGVLAVNRRPTRAHRISWEIHNGPIPPGLHVLHHCDNPLCVRPDHLFLGTQTDNMRDMVKKGRYRSLEAEQTHCKRGHPFDLFNTRYHDGQRHCRACNREGDQKRNLSYYTRGA